MKFSFNFYILFDCTETAVAIALVLCAASHMTYMPTFKLENPVFCPKIFHVFLKCTMQH